MGIKFYYRNRGMAQKLTIFCKVSPFGCSFNIFYIRKLKRVWPSKLMKRNFLVLSHNSWETWWVLVIIWTWCVRITLTWTKTILSVDKRIQRTNLYRCSSSNYKKLKTITSKITPNCQTQLNFFQTLNVSCSNVKLYWFVIFLYWKEEKNGIPIQNGRYYNLQSFEIIICFNFYLSNIFQMCLFLLIKRH